MMTNNFNNLINLASNDTIKDEITEKFRDRGRKIKVRELMKKEKKVLELVAEKNNPISKDKIPKKSGKKSRKFIKRSQYKKHMKKKKKEVQSVVFNFSQIKITEPMEKLLSRGLNFVLIPKTLNLT